MSFLIAFLMLGIFVAACGIARQTWDFTLIFKSFTAEH
jgi:hypothetical protein